MMSVNPYQPAEAASFQMPDRALLLMGHLPDPELRRLYKRSVVIRHTALLSCVMAGVWAVVAFAAMEKAPGLLWVPLIMLPLQAVLGALLSSRSLLACWLARCLCLVMILAGIALCVLVLPLFMAIYSSSCLKALMGDPALFGSGRHTHQQLKQAWRERAYWRRRNGLSI